MIGKGAALLLAVFILVFLVFAVTGEEEQKIDINWEEALELMEKKSEDDKLVLLDVRTPEEYQAGHIEGALNLDYYSPDFQEALKELDPEKTFIVYCRSGNRSATAVAQMNELGLHQAYNLLGGIIAWQEAGLPLISPE